MLLAALRMNNTDELIFMKFSRKFGHETSYKLEYFPMLRLSPWMQGRLSILWIRDCWQYCEGTGEQTFMKLKKQKVHEVSKHLTFPLSTPILHWMLFMIVFSDLLFYKCLQIVKPFPLMLIAIAKKAIWSNGSNYAGYREYTTDELLEALEIILFNTCIQFNGCIFKQTLGIPMGGNASPFIADLYLSWCEYCYMTKIKTYYAMEKLLSYNCRYLYDICTENLKYFGDIAKYIYDSILLFEGSAYSYKHDMFLDLYICVVHGKFVTDIYHKVDDFSYIYIYI